MAGDLPGENYSTGVPKTMTQASPQLYVTGIDTRDEAGPAGERWFSAARILLLTLLAAAPLALGAVEVWAWGSLAIGAVLVLVLWLLGSLVRGSFSLARTRLFIPAGLFLGLIFIQYFAHRASDVTVTREALVKFITYFIIFAVGGALFSGARRSWWRGLAVGITVYVFAMSFFAVIQNLSDPTRIFWVVKPRSGYIFGPYIYHNAYAGLLELLLPMVAGVVLYFESGWLPRLMAGLTVLLGLSSVVMAGSRGGTASIIVEAIIFLVIFLMRDQRSRRPLVLVQISAFVAIAGLVAVWMIPDIAATRFARFFDSPDVSYSDRKQMTLDAVRMFRDHALTGVGLGNFETVYPQYQRFVTDLNVGHAHNDYAELLAETGILGAALTLAGLAIFYLEAVCRNPLLWSRKQVNVTADRTRRPGVADWLPLSAMVGCTGLLFHSYIDFNMHIPANAAWFAFMAALATPVLIRHSPRRHAPDGEI